MRSFLFIATLTIAISIACTNRSVGSQSSLNNSTPIQSPTSVNGAAQTQERVPCTLTLTAAPVIMGLRLGMTREDVLALFPGSKDDPDVQRYLTRPPDRFGDSELVIRPAKYLPKEEPVRVKQISFSLLKGRVYEFNIGYNGPEFSHVDRFVEQLVKEASLPTVEQWDAYVGMDNQLKILSCKEFEVRAFAGGPGGNLNYVIVKDLVAEKELDDARTKAQAQAIPTQKL